MVKNGVQTAEISEKVVTGVKKEQEESQLVVAKVRDLLSSEHDYQRVLLEQGKGGQSCIDKFIAGISNLRLF